MSQLLAYDEFSELCLHIPDGSYLFTEPASAIGFWIALEDGKQAQNQSEIHRSSNLFLFLTLQRLLRMAA